MGGEGSEHKGFTMELEQVEDFEFRVRFDKAQFEEIRMDEPPPLGGDRGPNASRLLAAAVGNCLSASLLLCLRKSRLDVTALKTVVRTTIDRNEQGRLRVQAIDVEIDPGLDSASWQKAQRCLALYEDFCVVSQSVRQGVDVRVSVKGPEAK